jgi:hypothetical protein
VKKAVVNCSTATSEAQQQISRASTGRHSKSVGRRNFLYINILMLSNKNFEMVLFV